jgi:SAM-dependent methyltransferase
MIEGYHKSRFTPDGRRDILWSTLWSSYFRHRVPANACVLDLGCGYGQFINNVTARRRIGVDMWSGIRQHLQPDIEAIVGDASDLSAIEDGTVDFAFASNLFEHLTQEQLRRTLVSLRRKLTPSGTLTILQPNYRYAYREYFDDYTHISIYTHVSLQDFLRTNNYEILDVQPRFLPLTIKSRLPVWPALIRLYLALPFKPLGKQMLITARPTR